MPHPQPHSSSVFVSAVYTYTDAQHTGRVVCGNHIAALSMIWPTQPAPHHLQASPSTSNPTCIPPIIPIGAPLLPLTSLYKHACSHMLDCLWQGMPPRNFTPRSPLWTFWIRRRVLCSYPHLFGDMRFLWRFRVRSYRAHVVWMLCGVFSVCFEGPRCSNVSPHAQMCSYYAT